MINNKDIVIVVPVYLSILSSMETTSLKQCSAVLSKYDIVLIGPETLDMNIYKEICPQAKIVIFPNDYFKSLRSYNKLVLEESFYAEFASYKYMLIYQLDAFVFKDELLMWANKGYDYIGAPWLPAKRKDLKWTGRLRLFLEHLLEPVINKGRLYQERTLFYRVGNGGFSLRRIEKMIEVTHIYKKKIEELLDDNLPFYPEDVWLLLEVERKYALCRPFYKEAMKFAVEHNPWWAYRHNNRELPFGCHNWCNEPALSFWSQFIKLK